MRRACHLNIRREIDRASDVGGANEELRPVVAEEWRVPPTLVLRQPARYTLRRSSVRQVAGQQATPRRSSVRQVAGQQATPLPEQTDGPVWFSAPSHRGTSDLGKHVDFGLELLMRASRARRAHHLRKLSRTS
jgi:hypothetical protein